MTASVELVLLKCLQCGTPVPAEEDEVAWVCATCGRGLLLTETELVPINVQWAALSAGQGQGGRLGRPVWVFGGAVEIVHRESYSGGNQPDDLWRNPVRLFVPAYTCPLQELEDVGARLTRQQPLLTPGPPGPLTGCTLLPAEARAVAEFIVLTIEAERKDKLRTIDVRLNVGAPELWVMPL
jgi:hypothetical protein